MRKFIKKIWRCCCILSHSVLCRENRNDIFCEKGLEKRMTEKERDRKAVCLFCTSVGAYILAYLYLILSYQLNAREEVIACGFELLTFVGAFCAIAYSTLPESKISPEYLEELKRMIENWKEKE